MLKCKKKTEFEKKNSEKRRYTCISKKTVRVEKIKGKSNLN